MRAKMEGPLFMPSWNADSFNISLAVKLDAAQLRLASIHQSQWIQTTRQVVEAGYFQGALLGLVSIYALLRLIQSWRAGTLSSGKSDFSHKASHVKLPFEITSQIARVFALYFVTSLSIRNDVQWQPLDIAVVAVAFLAGVLRPLRRNASWRHVLLHVVNFLITFEFLLLFAAEIVPILDRHAAHVYQPSKEARGAVISLGTATVIALLTPREWVPTSTIYGKDVNDDATADELAKARAEQHDPAPEEICSWWTKYLTYEWITPLIWKGARRQVELDELPPLPTYDDPLVLLARLQKARAISRNTFTTTIRFVRSEILLMVLYAATGFAVALITPLAMYSLLAYLEDPAGAVLSPALWVALLFIGPMSRSVLFQQYVFTSTRLIVRIKSGMTQELYHRAMSSMELSEDILNDPKKSKDATESGSAAKKTTHSGQLQNLMAGDIDAIFNARDVVLIGVGAPVGISLSLFGLYKLVGWPALVGTVIIVLSIPVPVYVAQLMGKSQRGVKEVQDARISLISEYISSIRAIKYFAWEDAMIKTVEESRSAEQKILWRIQVLWTVMGEFGDFLPIVAIVSVFALYTLTLGTPLTASVAFTVLSLIRQMQSNIAMLSYFSKTATNAWISFDRLDRYFNSTVPLARHPDGPLRLENATFKRNKNATFRLADISVDFVAGGLNVVSGSSGSGKTTLLLSILGETNLESGKITRPNDTAFASQTTWLQNASIKDNILFTSPFDEARYQRIVDACCLGADFDELPNRDSTEVGENGVLLSGGQKSRVALARALYSKSDLVLLDDIFAALDATTSATVWELVFCGDLCKNRTVVLVTAIPWIANQADLSLVLDNGTVKSCEQNIGLVRRPIQVESEQATATAPTATNGVPPNGEEAKAAAKADKPKQTDIDKEMEMTGKTGRLSFFQYMMYFGSKTHAVGVLTTTTILNAITVSQTIWLSIWVTAVEKEDKVNAAFYLSIYAAICVTDLVFDACDFLLFAWGQWRAAKTLHAEMLRSVFYTSLKWFGDVPSGRVVNRFSKDIGAMDNALGRMLQITMYLAVQLLFRVGAVTSILPIFALPGVVGSLLGMAAGEAYTRTAVVVKRLVSSSQSPVFSQFADDMAGMQVIRARGEMAQRFGYELAARLRPYSRATEASYNANRWVSLRVDFITAALTTVAGWLAVTKAGIVPAGLVGFSLISATGLGDCILGLVRTSNELEVELQSFHRVLEYAHLPPEEKTEDPHASEGVSYRDHDVGEQTIPENWPRSGSVEFRNVTIRYDNDGPDILKDVNLKFAAGERVAVVGRTGSGKSTLVLSLLRFTQIVSGTILYDGVDITRIPRKRLRQALTIIPQEATLFNGNVQSNLDPSGTIDESIIESAIRSCAGIASFQSRGKQTTGSNTPTEDQASTSSGTAAGTPVAADETALLIPKSNTKDQSSSNDNGTGYGAVTIQEVAKAATGLQLSNIVDAKGENFSHGQRQVLSLCRALVRKSKLMLLDEATASMDYATDAGIQQVLRKDLAAVSEAEQSTRTLVTIAHRLRTIADYDTVVVMGAGRVVETGSPRELFEKKGAFYSMTQHSGELEELKEAFGSA